MKRIRNTVIGVLSVVALLMAVGFTESELNNMPYRDLQVNIDTRHGNFFITQEEIEAAVLNMGYEAGQTPIEAINIKELEDFLDRYPAVDKSQVFSSLQGTLHIHIRQRRPIMRVFSRNGDSYYLDNEGYLMPLSGAYTARVRIANGEIEAPYHQNYAVCFAQDATIDPGNPAHRQLRSLYMLADHMQQEPFWSAQISQVYWNEEGDIELIPRVGNHRIILGDHNNLEDKLNKLKVFYLEGLNKTNWNDYTTINLKYNNQVVCTKKQTYGSN